MSQPPVVAAPPDVLKCDAEAWAADHGRRIALLIPLRASR